MSLRVLQPGLFSLVVDAGRPRTRHLGVAVGGAADRTAFALGNALVGSPPGAAALEITLVGPTLRAESDVGAVVFGAPFPLWRDDQPLPPGTTFTLRAGQVLRIGATPEGARAYLCVAGGLQTPLVLGSRSGFAPVAEGDLLPCPPARLPGRLLPFLRGAEMPAEGGAVAAGSRRNEEKFSPSLRAIEGSQAAWFRAEAFFAQTYVVTPASNRMGVRLRGSPLTRPAREMVSEPVAPGAVQVTNEGQPIVLGVDGQTIGGYPKVAHVIRADLDLLAQLRPNESVRFTPVSPPDAERLGRRRAAALREWLARLRAAGG